MAESLVDTMGSEAVAAAVLGLYTQTTKTKIYIFKIKHYQKCVKTIRSPVSL